MSIEIDQSGKLEQLDTTTVVAFSNETSGAVYIKAGTKRKVTKYLRSTLIPQKEIYPIFFAILTFLLISSKTQKETMVIDEEYTGKESVIKESLEKLLIKHLGKKWQGAIRFKRIGKRSSAHKLAWKIHRQKSRVGIKQITESEILKLLE